MSPRRSSRARTNQPSPLTGTNASSSTSSTASSRAERSTRSNDKTTSTHDLARSQSLDDPLQTPKPPARRTRSGDNHDSKELALAPEADDDEEEDQDEEEVTRCLCQSTDYPGMTAPLREALRKDGLFPADAMLEDVGNMFIQCDLCKVWQHGGCVGILDDNSAPADYFCEQCREDLHRVDRAPDGQKYSRYLPLTEQGTTDPSPKSTSRDKRSRDAKDIKTRASAEALAQKRRHTLNSRDEAEELERAIEESKKENNSVGAGDGGRNGKRSRSDSDERKAPAKRQRTESETPSPDKVPQAPSSEDDALAVYGNESAPRKIRGAAARNHHEKQQREERERERLEAANRRKARSERRRAEDSELEKLPPTLLHDHLKPPSTAASSPPASSDHTPQPPSTLRSHKKKPMPPTPATGKRGRLGRNQYTRDDEEPNNMLGVDNADNPHMTRGRSRSRSAAPETEETTSRGKAEHNPQDGAETNGRTSGGSGDGSDSTSRGHTAPGTGRDKEAGAGKAGDDGAVFGKPSRVKHLNPNRTSLNEMKKRVAAILDFVNRAQEMGGSRADGVREAETEAAPGVRRSVEGRVNGVNGRASAEEIGAAEEAAAQASVRDFAGLERVEMLASLRGRLTAFESSFGRWGEKRS